MLILGRTPLTVFGEPIRNPDLAGFVIVTPAGERIVVRVLESRSPRAVRIGIDAPRTCQIYRQEIEPDGRACPSPETPPVVAAPPDRAAG